MAESDRPTESSQPESAPWRHERKGIMRSFRYAWDGVLFTFMTQRHMRVHAVIITLVMLAAWGLGVTELQMLFLLSAMALVIITEMLNTVAEMIVDMVVDTYNPHAKTIKDIAAGAVMVASLYAVGVAVLVFFINPRLREIYLSLPYPPRPEGMDPIELVTIGCVVIGVIIAWLKYRTGRGTFWRGGIVSGHTAAGFLITTSIWIITRNFAVTVLALAMAILISQSRLQARIHSPLEIMLGALMGIVVALLVFYLPVGYFP